jgi:hypothetical protein
MLYLIASAAVAGDVLGCRNWSSVVLGMLDAQSIDICNSILPHY